MVAVAIILAVGAYFESNFVSRQFNELEQVLNVLYEKVDDQTATESDVYAVQDNWLNKKKYLHAFIPHNEIKEVDLWLSETVTLVDKKEWTDALSKVEVLLELSEQIPKTFKISFENIL
jgi:hypothetical protein